MQTDVGTSSSASQAPAISLSVPDDVEQTIFETISEKVPGSSGLQREIMDLADQDIIDELKFVTDIRPKKERRNTFQKLSSKLNVSPSKVKSVVSAVSTLAADLQKDGSPVDKLGALKTFHDNLKKETANKNEDPEKGNAGMTKEELSGTRPAMSTQPTVSRTNVYVNDYPMDETDSNDVQPKKPPKKGLSKLAIDPTKMKSMASAVSTLATDLQKDGSPMDKLGALKDFHSNVKQDQTTALNQDDEPSNERRAGTTNEGAPSESDESEKSKGCCTKAGITSLIFTLISYGGIVTMGYFNFQTRLETMRSDLSTCKAVRSFPSLGPIESGIYKLKGSDGTTIQVYCDMTTDDGGWTFVASVHENNAGPSGHCTMGDRWSSQLGTSDTRPSGDNNWANLNTFGTVVSATVDDYKSQAYFENEASDIMIWQVPNGTPAEKWLEKSYLRYHTTSGFLQKYGKNLFNMYHDYFPIVSSNNTESGPTVEVAIDKGFGCDIVPRYAPNIRTSLRPGFIQFRAFNQHGDAFAICPGVKFKSGTNHAESACIGSTGNNFHSDACGDFPGFYSDDPMWKADEVIIDTTFLIFYR